MEFLKLEDLSIEQKIGMVLCARRFREDDIEFILELVKNRALGSFQAPTWGPEIIKKIKDAAAINQNTQNLYESLSDVDFKPNLPLPTKAKKIQLTIEKNKYRYQCQVFRTGKNQNRPNRIGCKNGQSAG